MLTSILDNDLYKFTMQQAVLRHYPMSQARYALFYRKSRPYVSGTFVRELEAAVREMSTLCLQRDERAWLETCGFFSEEYLDMLARYRFDPNEVHFTLQDGFLDISVRGSWFSTILWEVPLLAIMSELLYSTESGCSPADMDAFQKRSAQKARKLAEAGCHFTDFGTRRRYSWHAQRMLIETFTTCAREEALIQKHFSGTSNCALAKEYALPAIGTMAHEWVMGNAAFHGTDSANREALVRWQDVYGSKLGIALTDTYTTEQFLEIFDEPLARSYSGVRQDSGDPEVFVDKMLRHYASLGIDATEKTVIFSDQLNETRAAAIESHVNGRLKTAYGIGTYLTNDFPGVKPLEIVIKLTALDGQKVYKLSDDPAKSTKPEGS